MTVLGNQVVAQRETKNHSMLPGIQSGKDKGEPKY
jgi:hypothetical protein